MLYVLNNQVYGNVNYKIKLEKMNFKINQKYFFIVISLIYLIILSYWFAILNSRNEQDQLTLKSAFYFTPKISILIINFFNTNVHAKILLFLKVLIIPFSIYLLLVKIYNKYISLIWSALLALTSLSIYNNMNFRDFIFLNEKITNYNYEPLIFDFPIPGFSSLYFLIVYALIITIKKINNWYLLILSLLASLDFYINPIDALFLIGIWAIYLILKLNKGIKIQHVIINFFIILSIVLFGLITANLSVESASSYSISIYNLFAYLLLPLSLMVTLYFIQRIDIYEIYNRFSHIYFFMAIEMFIIILSYSNILPINLDILETRILQFFIHLFYYVPVIYFLAKPKIKLEYSFGSESSFFAKKMRFFSTFIYNISENFITVIISIMLILYNIFPLLNTLK
jgi:hypothetical protein